MPENPIEPLFKWLDHLCRWFADLGTRPWKEWL